jgi:hypothetical protein
MPDPGFVFTGRSGCLLPMLIIFNLFFGRFIFNSNSLWLGIEGILVLLFIIKLHIFTRKITAQLWPQGRRPQGHGLASGSQSHKPQNKIVDIQGQVVEDESSAKELE